MKGRLLVAVQFGCLIALVLLPASGTATPLRALIACLSIVLAVVVLAVAFVNLRKSVTVFPEPLANAPLVTNGIHRHVRHPMYLGVLLFGGGLTVSKWTLATAIVFVVLVIDLRIKYRFEDRLLAEKWPTASEYQQRVGALLPRIGRR